MILLDSVAPNLRRAVARWPEAPSLKSHYGDLASTLAANGNSVIELTKSFIECVCTTILLDAGKPVVAQANTTQLLKDASEAVGLVHKRGASRFDKLLSSYFKVTDAINDLRNNEGTVAHGKDGFLDELSLQHHRILVLTADAVVALLLSSLERTEPDLLHTRRHFDTFEQFNAEIDTVASCTAAVLEIDSDEETLAEEGQLLELVFKTPQLKEGVSLMLRPSEILFTHDRGAYVEILNSVPPRPIPSQENEEDSE